MSLTDHDRAPTTDETLEQLGRLALQDSSLPTVLQQVVQLLGSAMPPGSETSVSVQARGELLCVPTGDIARQCTASGTDSELSIPTSAQCGNAETRATNAGACSP